MEVLIERACGLDVHKKSITACIVTPDGKEIKTFRTHTVYLIDLVDWRDMLVAMIEGETDPKKLAGFARRTLKRKKDELELALRGNMSAHQRLMLKAMLTHIDLLNEQIVDLDTEVANRLDPFQEQLDRLDTIPGIARRTAEQILAEIGTDVGARFQVLLTFAHGSDLFRGTTKAPVNASLPRLVKGTNISELRSQKPHNPYEGQTTILVPNTDVLQPVREGNVPPSRLHIR